MGRTLWPNGSTVIPRVTSEFNPARRHPITGRVQPHNGIDLVGWSIMKSPVDGVISYAAYAGSAGNQINVKDASGDVFVMMHNARFLVRVGTRVSAGQDIAVMGTTGSSTGVHSHFECRPGDRTYVNPRVYMAGKIGSGGSGGSGSPANVSGGQRTAGPNGVRRRSQPSSAAAEGESLNPGTVGDFNGWIRGENVSGNDVWYRGSHSGDWFWSGGFVEGANGTGLEDLNPKTPAPIGAQQRRAIAASNGRADATTAAAVKQTLDAGTVGDFNGWKHGETVEGENRWIRGSHSGDWFWLAAFEPRNVDGLADLNPAAPPVTPPTPPAESNQRTVGPNGARRRSLPSSSAPEAGAMLAAGEVGTFNAWARGEAVSGNDVWYRGISGDWFWSGGFTSSATAGLSEVPAPTTPVTPPPATNVDNPRGLPTYPPFYPGAFIGLDAPLGDGPRGQKGLPPNVVKVPLVIDQFHLHRTGSNGDDGEWFSYRNSRSSCPHLHVLQDGRTREFIRPKMKPALTGPEWNWRGYGIEIQGAGDGTAAQFERVADIMAWLASYEGRELDGVPVTYNLRARAGTTLNHREMFPGTECPGDWWAGRMDALIERARVLLAEKYSPADPDPEPVPELPEPWRSRLERIVDELNGVLGR